MKEFQIIQDTYNFNCTMCGNCCTGDMTVHLHLYDLYKMGKYLELNHTEYLFKRNLVKLYAAENNTWQPVIRFKRKPFKFCPFLNNEMDEQGNLISLCDLHPDYKPLICAMAPVGRVADLGEKNDEFIFVKPAPDCPGVEAEQVQYLSQVTQEFDKELEYQKRYFHLLEKCSDLEWSKDLYYANLYCFPVQDNFNRLLNEIESKINKL